MTSAFRVLPAAERAAILSLLSRVIVREADAALLAHLSRPEIADVLERLEPGVGAEIERALAEPTAREDLDVEYCRLFLLPGGVPPFAVAWTGGEAGTVRARLQAEVGAVLEALALRPGDHGLGNLPLDHVGVLLALAAVAEAREPDGPLAAEALGLLRPWGGRFAAALAETSEAGLYRATARLLDTVLA